MSQQGVIKRYTLIIEKVRNSKFPTKQEIADHLNDHDFEISLRTLDRDIEQIRYEFGIDLLYDKSYRGYRMDYANSINIESFLKFLEIANTAEFLQQSLKESKESLRFISFDTNTNLKGIGYLKDILRAIREKKRILFTYEKFNGRKLRRHAIEPYLLKEYLNRWYVIGKLQGTENFGTFGLDRITEMKISDDTFEYNEEDNPAVFFDSIIGINYDESVIEDVILSFIPEQADYIKTLPLHKSQEIIADNEKELRIKLQIIPNFELEQIILMQGERVKVLEPEWLAKKIKKRLSAATGNYKS